MRARLGHDFSQVRVHADTRAAALARDLSAEAMTYGENIFFAEGRYDPTSASGWSLLTHEAIHALQQRHAGDRHAPTIPIEHPNGRHETAATSVVAGLHAGTHLLPWPPPSVPERSVMRQVAPLPSASRAPVTVPPPPAATPDPAWVVPPGVRQGAVPVYDAESNAVVAFRYSSGGYWEVYDLEGRQVEAGELPLESPLIDPIDILAGAITGLGRSLLGGAARAAARTATTTAAEAGASTVAGVGLREAAALLSRNALAAVRAAFRTIRFGRTLNFTATTAAHMAESGRHVPIHILQLAIRWGRRVPDPQGVAGAFRYVIPMSKGVRDKAGAWIYKQYTLEVVLRESDTTILHFLYRP